MKATGIVRRVDDLGRIVIPKEIRRTMRIRESEPLEIFTGKEGEIILKKYSPVQNVNDFVIEFAESIYNSNKKDVVITDNERVIAAAGNYKKDIVGKKISLRLEDKISKRSTIVVNKTDKIEICDNVELKKPSIIKPINVYGDIIGCVVVSSDKDITDVDKSLAEFSGVFMSRYLEG